MLQVVKINDGNSCQSAQAEFKIRFINSLPRKLELNGCKVALF